MALKKIKITKNHYIGENEPVFIIAELSANHNQKFDTAVKLIKAAKEAGADAVKLQTYTPDTITIDCKKDYFKIKGTIWDGKYLYDLYKEAYMPWEWQPKLKKIAEEEGLIFFSTPYDKTAVEFLEDMKIPIYKIASFELVDIPLIEYIASKGKPIIMSTGMATLEEIKEAVNTIKMQKNNKLILLKCTSAYPAPFEEMNLKTISHLAEAFDVPTGLSDHTLGISTPIAAVSLGACIIEKHFTLSRSIPTPDSSFSLEPGEFKIMVKSIREAEKALGKVQYCLTQEEKVSKKHRRSLFAVNDIEKDDFFTEKNVRSIRPGYGLHPKYIKKILGKNATKYIKKGIPLSWDLIK